MFLGRFKYQFIYVVYTQRATHVSEQHNYS